VGRFFVDEGSAETMRASGWLPTVAAPRQMVVESYSLVEFVSLLQSVHVLKESEAERAELQRALQQQLAAPRNEEENVTMKKRQQAQTTRELRVAALRQQSEQLRQQLEREQQLLLRAQRDAQTLCAQVLRGRLWIGSAVSELELNARSRLPELKEQRRGMREGTGDDVSCLLFLLL
jgi:hypothetical protein